MADFHPLLIHFPIALLTLYALFEIASFKFLRKQPWLFELKAVLVITGILGAFVSLSSGDEAAERIGGVNRALVNVHSSYALASTWIFGVLAAIYLISWLVKLEFPFKKDSALQKSFSVLQKVMAIVRRPFIMILLAIAGLTCLSITGALGGALVHGSGADPVVSLVYNLFF